EYDGTWIDQEYADGLEAEWVPLIEEAIEKVQVYAQTEGFPKDPKVTGAQQKAILCPECTAAPHLEPQELALLDGVDRKEWRKVLNEQLPRWNDPSCKRCMKRRFVLVPDDRINVRSSKQLQHLCFDI